MAAQKSRPWEEDPASILNMAAVPPVPHFPTAPTNILKRSAPCLTSYSPGNPAGGRRRRRRQAGREEVGLPLGPHHLHWPHHFSAGQAAHSSNGWQFQFVTFLCHNF